MMSRSLNVGVGVVLALAMAALCLASTASARTLSMRGEWYMNRGPLVDIPANGGPVFCGGPDPLLQGCVNSLRPLNGGIPAAGANANVTGAGPAAFTIPFGAFALAGGPANRQTVPVNGIPTVIQLASQFSLLAPAGTGLNGTGIVPGGPATFMASAHLAQPGRLGPNFTWCPPAGNCTVGGTYGAYRAVMRYTAGAARFGGTMHMMLRDTGVVSIRLGGPGGTVLHQLVGGTTNPSFGPQMAGGGYAVSRMLVLAPGPVHSTYMVGLPCTSGLGQQPSPPGCGKITGQGAFLFNAPSSTNNDFGMPWTTGTVLVRNLPGPVPSKDPNSTFSLMGTDQRTPLGRGRITLVAGATTERLPSGNHFAAIEVMNIKFSAAGAPLLSPPAIAAVVALMLLAGGYMARRSFAAGTAR